MKREVIQESIAEWTEEPDRARARLSVAARSAGTQAVVESGIFSWWCDLPPSLGGSGQAPSPSTLLLSALASCAVVFLRDTLACQLGLSIQSVEATVQCDTDYRGLLALDGAAAGLGSVGLRIRVVSSEGTEAVENLYRLWKERSPVLLALAPGLPIEMTLEVTSP